MSAEEERVYTQYFYNSVIEFIYFILLYLEVYKVASLNNLVKYVKLFKIEVTNLISSFDGKILEDKLYQFLCTLDCFVLVDGKVKVNENIYLKDSLFEDLILSKCVDLILKGINNIDDICKNLNYNNVIAIDKQNLQHIIDKYSYISIDGKIVILHHLHGLLSFEDYVHNSVISYFHDILYHCKIMSINEIESHSKCLTFCGNYNIIIVFSILNCSSHFMFQNGYVFLKEKSKKYPKKQPICVELMEAKYLPRSLPVAQIIYSMYGSFLCKWSGEIVNISKNSGNIYCVIDFTNGHQGLFYVFFNKASLKVISEVESLEKYLKVRDAVEFDAEYYSSKKFDLCWRATRVKLLHSNKLKYDEILLEKLNTDSKQHRHECVGCYSNINSMISHSFKFKNSECEKRQITVGETGNKLCSFNGSFFDSDTVLNKYANNEEVTSYLYTIISNLPVPEYVFIFGYVHMLMKDKIIAIAKHEDEIYNVLFMKDSICPLNNSQSTLVKGQKVITCIPYIKKLDPFPVAIFVYGLSEEETNDTENGAILPEQFADKVFLQYNMNNLCNKFCNHNNIMKDSSIVKRFKTDLRVKAEVTELYSFIKSQCKVPFQNNYLLEFLHTLSKMNFNGLNFNSKVFHFILKISKYLTKKAIQPDLKHKSKFKKSENDFSSQAFIQLQELYTNPLIMKTGKNKTLNSCSILKSKSLHVVQDSFLKKNNVMNSNLNLKSKSLDMVTTSLTSLDTYSASDSSETFYSCESKRNTPKCSSNCSLDKCSQIFTDTEGSFDGTRIEAKFSKLNIFPEILYEDTCLPTDSKQGFKVQNSFKDSHHRQHLGLYAVSHRKCSIKKRVVVLPCFLKYFCKNCTRSPFNPKAACVSMISESFFFLTTNIDNCNVVLPMAKQNIPKKLQENMKLKSCCEITISPSVFVNFSHIILANIIM